MLVLYQLQIITGYVIWPFIWASLTGTIDSIFLSYVLDLATHNIPNSASWRVPVGLQLAWGLILFSGIFFLPESPRHLLGQNRGEEARKVIAELNSVPEDDPLVLDIIEELEVGIAAENEGGKATWAECFSTRNMLWKRTANGMMLQFIQQLNGQNFYCKSMRTWPSSFVLCWRGHRLLRGYILQECRYTVCISALSVISVLKRVYFQFEPVCYPSDSRRSFCHRYYPSTVPHRDIWEEKSRLRNNCTAD